MKSIRHSLARLSLPAFALILVSCSEDAVRQPDEPSVRVFQLSAPGERPFRSFPGELAAAGAASLSFDVPGRIIELSAEPGQSFKQGDMLARLDPENFDARLSAAQAQFDTARQELDRRRALRESRAVSQSEVEQAQRVFDVAESELRTARQQLFDSVLRAPFDGRVGQRQVSNFETIRPGQIVLDFVDLASMEVKIDLPEQDLTFAPRGVSIEEVNETIEAKVEFATLPGQAFPLKLKSFGTRATAGSRTFPVVFKFTPPEEVNLLPGMTATVRARAILHQNEPLGAGVFEVPAGAVLEQDGKSGMWRVDPGTRKVGLVPVEMLGMSDGFVRVRGGTLKAGDEFVQAGSRFLSEGQTVRPLRGR
jgi:RND family efflux transporter MFP subunit